MEFIHSFFWLDKIDFYPINFFSHLIIILLFGAIFIKKTSVF